MQRGALLPPICAAPSVSQNGYAPHVQKIKSKQVCKTSNNCQQSSNAFCRRCARLPRQNRTDSDAKSRDFRLKPAQFRAKNAHKQPQITFETSADAAHHLQHIKKHSSVRGALAARLLRAQTLQKPTRTHAIFLLKFLNFSRQMHRTFKNSNQS